MATTITQISPALRKLLEEPSYAEIATLMPDGSPQITQVWIDTDGEHALINTTEDRQKTKNVRRDPRVAVNAFDPSNQWRIASMRGRVVEITSEGAVQHIHKLSFKYRGEAYSSLRPGEVRVILKILPEEINTLGLE